MEARTELEHLLADLLDLPPDTSRNQRLNEFLRKHPELQGEYLETMQLHALLLWRGGNVQPQDKPADKFEKVERVPETVVTSWRATRTRGVAAALLFLAASVALFLVWHTPEAQAMPDVVERLIDWNLDLTQARSPEDRSRIYDEQAVSLKATLANAELPAEDRKLAQSLLDNSVWLTTNVDPAAEADRFDAIAEKLVTQMDDATSARDEKRIVQLADAYHRVTERGVDANLALASASNPTDPEKKQQLAHTFFRHHSRTSQVAEIIERNPERSRKLIHRATKGQFHKTKKFK